jgi:hypothetical protein
MAAVDSVRADLERERKRVDWLLGNLIESNHDVGAMRIAGALMLGKTGRELVDAAMESA